MGLPSTIDPHDLAETGWGLVVSRDEDPAVVGGLRPLLDRRRAQAGDRFRELTYHPHESGRRFLWLRHGEAPGVLDPDVLPYYLLIVGSPEEIPFEFQYDLAINHAVGRIAFDDPVDYARYAETVLHAEDQGVDLPRRATIFSVELDGDPATSLLAEHLVSPLSSKMAGYADWEVDVWSGERAYKEDLRRLLGGEATPGLLMVSCAGIKKAPGSADQKSRQGALLCRDYPGKGHVPGPEHSFSGDDLPEAARLRGLIAYLFADHGVGTPLLDSFPHKTREGMVVGQPPPAEMLALDPFIARLPQELLSRGALAVVGHIDRGWTTAFQWQVGEEVSIEAVRSLEDSLRQLLGGDRIGHTLRPLVRRYTAIASQLSESLERVRNGEEVDEELVAFQWTAAIDARSVLLLGDPAVYLLGQRCWEGEVGLEEERGWVQLDPGNLRHASEQAAAAEVSVSRWVNQRLGANYRRSSHSELSTETTRAESRVPVSPDTPPLVFISYAWEDRELVGEIRQELGQRGINVWIDTDPEEGIRVGQRIGLELQRRLSTSDYAIFCLSNHSVSKKGRVQEELNWALRHQEKVQYGKEFIIPIKLDPCDLPDPIWSLDLRYLLLSEDRVEREQQLDQLARQILRGSGQAESLE